VRAKIAALRAQQVAASFNENGQRRALDYLALADRYARELGPPGLIIVCGLMGSGKTTLATGLADLLGSDVLSTDSIRRELLGASPSPAAFNEGHYVPEFRRRVYREMLRHAGILLRQGLSVVLDGTFLKAAQREAAQELAEASGAVPLVVHCTCPATVAVERIEHRATGSSQSESRPERYASQQSAEEPATNNAIEVDTTVAMGLQEAAVLEALAKQLAAH